MDSTKIDWHLWRPRYSKGQMKVFLGMLAFIAVAIVTYEIYEHKPTFLSNIDTDFIGEALVLGIALPVLFGFVVFQWIQARSEKFQLARLLSLRSEFNRRLSQLRTWDELADLLVRFPAKAAPLCGASLMVYNPNYLEFQQAAAWKEELEKDVSHYWIPLAYQEHLVAALVLFYPSGTRLSLAEISFFKDLSTEMALAVKLMHPILNSETLAEAFVAVDRQIARDLHDTLAQDLAFLRLKLEHLSGSGNSRDIQVMRQDLQALRRSADQAYEQVRGKLIRLYPDSSGDLVAALGLVTESTGRQSTFDVHYRTEGQPRSLPEQISHNIVAIVQEALVNAGKHSQANSVDVRLIWARDGLFVKVDDNGIGFNPAQVPGNGHMGLNLMAERARAIQGQLEVESLPGTGTEVTLRVTFPPHENHAAAAGDPVEKPLERGARR